MSSLPGTKNGVKSIVYYSKKSQKLFIDNCLPGHHDQIQNCMNRFKIVSNRSRNSSRQYSLRLFSELRTTNWIKVNQKLNSIE